MRMTGLWAALLAGVAGASVVQADMKNIQFFTGACSEESHLAEGPLGSDLTKRQSRFHCDAMVRAGFDDDPGRMASGHDQRQRGGALRVSGDQRDPLGLHADQRHDLWQL